MYAPLPPRPRKTSISRSRNGCVPCRQKKRKCDEARPQCLRCTRTGAMCWFQKMPLRFRSVNTKTIRSNDSKDHQWEYNGVAVKVSSKPVRHDGCSSDSIVEPASPPNDHRQQDNLWGMTTEQLYLSYFTQELTNMLPESVRAVASRMTELSSLREAVIALSAARLASIESEQQRRPRFQHFSEALSRFISAVQHIRTSPADIENVLAAVIHLVLFELEVGTLWGVCCHVAGLENLLMLHQDVLMESRYGRTLLRAGVFLRMRTLFLLNPLSSLGTEPATGRYLQRLVDEIAQPREIIYINMTRAVSMTTHLILAHCMQHDHDAWHRVAGKIYSRFQDTSMQPADPPMLPEATEGRDIYIYLKEIEERNKAVISDSGYEPLGTMLSKPRESNSNERQLFLNIPELNPIRFDQCEEAIFSAVYALSQIYCDGKLLQSLLYQQELESNPHVTEHVKTILGIAKGYDPASCFCDSVYNMNISWVLVLLALRWPTQEVMRYLKDDFLPRLQRTDALREDTVGALPCFSRIVNLLDTETTRGRRIYTMQPVYADSAEREHFFLMNQVQGYAIHGRDREGHFFNDYIST
ncbi:hypothetical protein BDV37DRAFT_149759 [Aspergillus pseudonomiae]|uniref:Zn(2)-C6 fungal-type domain-containing protein n=1 Tax=Aspergillus pseudonomiae TaxID=1506151 RepID=A0A5N7DAD7_9EURO|nr:uncharacterized protein BDV37DRAFT_149759 [Aspergillus pseudonomiae]KAE8402983.1 hypothetical protein BDV37DRAFT_149759 [Aspergillus pseudonomiae]